MRTSTVIASCSPNPVGSAPVSRWRSRRWRGWFGRSSRRSTATTRSSTTRSWSSASSARAWSSSTTSTEVPDGQPDHAVGARLGSRGRRRRQGSAAASWSIRCARSSPRSTTRSRSGPARATGSCTSATTATRRPSARWRSRPSSISRVESVDEVDQLPDFDEPVALLAQTTLSHRDWEGVAVRVRERFPDVWTPGRSDLCFATTNRQSSLLAIAERCDAIVVIGSSNSSNTRALGEARDRGRV